MRGLATYENGLCDCGWHESLTGDRANHFTFEDRVCPVCSGAARYARIQGDRDEKAMKRLGGDPAPDQPRPGDGRRTFTRLMSPDEVSARVTGRASQ